MKKLLYVAVCLLTVQAAIAGSDPSKKILQIFSQSFPKAEEVKWAEDGDKAIVKFKDGGIATEIVYDMDGNVMSTERYYSEKNLPVKILGKLQKKFPGMTIFGVTEMTTPLDLKYFIKMEDSTSWMTVKSDEGGHLVVAEKYKKGE